MKHLDELRKEYSKHLSKCEGCPECERLEYELYDLECEYTDYD